MALTATGLDVKTAEEIIDDIDADLRDAFGTSIALDDDSAIGRFRAIIALHIAEVWELAEAAYNAQDPDSASGDSLDKICALTGTTRNAPTQSTVTLTLTGDNATVVPSLSRASVDATEELFETLADATLVTTAAWAPTTAYVIGDRVTNNSNVYVCTVAGTSAGSGGPTTETTAIVDGSATWDFVGTGVADIDALAQSVNTGPIVASSRDISTIETPVAGWDGVRNLLDATLGSDEEADEDLRIRRVVELTSGANSPPDAIRADLLNISTVTACTVFYNNTDVTDGDGVPPHAVEALVTGDGSATEDQAVWDQLLASVAAGIYTHGTEVGTAEDSQGNDQTVRFSRPTEINIYVTLTLTYDADLWPTDGDDQVADAIVAFGDAQKTGKDVVSSAMKAQAFSVAGVLDVSLAYIGTAPSPSSESTIAISTRQLAMFDTSRIIVNSSAATP